MASSTVAKHFVSPYFFPELGTEGLTAGDIADSLCIKPSHARHKVKRSGFMDQVAERKTIQAVEYLTCGDSGRTYIEYIFDLNAAILFVAGYDTLLAGTYLAHLVKLADSRREERYLNYIKNAPAFRKARERQLKKGKKTK